MAEPSLLLTPAELEALTGLRQPAAQLAELHRQGYARALRARGGPVVLPRVHFEAVNAAQSVGDAPANNETASPNVVGLQQWAQGRGRRGQKTQRR